LGIFKRGVFPIKPKYFLENCPRHFSKIDFEENIFLYLFSHNEIFFGTNLVQSQSDTDFSEKYFVGVYNTPRP